MEKRYLFKQACKFDYLEKKGDGHVNSRKFFSLGAHLVPSEIEKLDHFKLLCKHNLIIEQGVGPAPTAHEGLLKSIEDHKDQTKEMLEPTSEEASSESEEMGGSSEESEEMSESEDKKENRKNRKNKR